MGTTTDKTTYLNNTKLKIKDGINRLGGELTNLSTFRSYETALNDIYDKLPKVTGTGSDLSLTPTLKGGLNIVPIGNAEQDGTPTPTNSIDVKVVTGDNRAVACNKNFIDNTNLNYSWANVASSYIQLSTLDTGIRFESTFPSGAPVIAFKLFDLNNYIGKTIRMKSKMTSGGQYRLDLIDENATSVTPIQTASTSEQVLSYTVPNNLTDKHYLAFTLIDIVGTSRQIDFTDLILTIEDDNLTYVPHQEQSKLTHLNNLELCKIGDYQDYITGTKDNWKVVRKVGKIVYDGSSDENWYISNNGNHITKRFRMVVNNIKQGPLNNQYPLLSNRFTQRSNLTTTEDNFVHLTTGDGWVWFGAISLDEFDVNGFKNWLSSNNVILYYVLATPTEETITDTTLINELNDLQDMLSYDGTTNITITSDTDNAQMLVEVRCLKGE